MRRRSDVGTGASWQVHAHLRQRAVGRNGGPVDCRAWNGCSLPPGSSPRFPRTSRRTPAPTPHGSGGARRSGPQPPGGPGRRLPARPRHAGRRRAGGVGGPVPARPARPDQPSLAPHPGRQRAAAGRAGAARPLEPAEAGPPPAAVGPGPAGDAVARAAAAGPEVPGGCTGGAPLPRRRVGTRRRRPTRRGGVPGRCGLRRRGHAARRRRARDAAPQTRLFAGLPPLHRVRRAAAGDRLRPPAATSVRTRRPIRPPSNTSARSTSADTLRR